MYLSHSTTNSFFSFHLCPTGISLTYSVQIFCGVMFPANQKLVYVILKCLNVQKRKEAHITIDSHNRHILLQNCQIC